MMRDLAHELRDSLSAVTSSLDLLRQQNFDPEVGRLVAERVDRGLRRALAAVDAFVVAEDCELGTLSLEPQRCSLNHILDAARSALAGQAAARCVFTPAPVSIEVSADIAQSVHVVAALLQHASAIALPGTVEVQAMVGSSHPEIRIRMRTDASVTGGEHWFVSYLGRTHGAMALRTARALMALQRGDLQLSAPCSTECELVVTFAREASGAAVAQPREERDQGSDHTQSAGAPRVAHAANGARELANTHIIIVDDSAEVRTAYRDALRALGYTVTEALDAEEALRSIACDRPHVALIDIHLPTQMNGYRLAQAIRVRFGSAVRLIMLSGMTLDAVTRHLARQAGFDDCLDKMAGSAAVHGLLQADSDNLRH